MFFILCFVFSFSCFFLRMSRSRCNHRLCHHRQLLFPVLASACQIFGGENSLLARIETQASYGHVASVERPPLPTRRKDKSFDLATIENHLKSIWDPYEVRMRSIWGQSEVHLESIWGSSVVHLGSIWHRRSIRGSSGVRLEWCLHERVRSSRSHILHKVWKQQDSVPIPKAGLEPAISSLGGSALSIRPHELLEEHEAG